MLNKFFHLNPKLLILFDLGVDNLSLHPQIFHGVVKISLEHLPILTSYGAPTGGSANLFITLVRILFGLVHRVLLHLLNSISLFFFIFFCTFPLSLDRICGILISARRHFDNYVSFSLPIIFSFFNPNFLLFLYTITTHLHTFILLIIPPI